MSNTEKSPSHPKEKASESQCYENPNYRRMYAKLSMDEMIGSKEDLVDSNADSKQQELEFYFDEDDEFYDDEEDEEDESEGLEYLEVEKDLATSRKDTKAKPANQLVDCELPEGWERHEDELGPYFWHIPTGTIQRERPCLTTIDKSMIRSDSLVFLDKSAITVDYAPSTEHDTIEEHPTEDHDGEELEDFEHKSLLSNRKKVIANLRLTFPTDDEEEDIEEKMNTKELSFVVHSLGWLDVEESQINSQTGSMVIKKCIYELTTRAESATRAWGPEETQSLLLKLTSDRITLIDPTSGAILSTQAIREIRMWAVDDQSNFAYVVKESNVQAKPGTLKCLVFHCADEENQNPAQRIAIYLKDVLVRLKTASCKRSNGRPSDLLLKNTSRGPLESLEFPTPIEEPKKTLPALYMGYVPVQKAMGVDVLNMAIDEVLTSLKLSVGPNTTEQDLMRPVLVHVSPSNIVVECRDSGATLLECRVRYLSFLGISLDSVKRCGFIVQISESEYVTHCFEAEPSAGPLCKTVEAACKLRYQKCLDAHRIAHKPYCAPQSQNEASQGSSTASRIASKTSPVATAIKNSISGVFSKIISKAH